MAAKSGLIGIRLDDKERKQLEKEASVMGLKLSTYIKHLVHTHPARTKK
jgi:predicted DNA binding CopG/RHH family protein